MKNENILNLDNYTWYGNNRKNIHIKAPKASGGVGIFVHHRVSSNFKVTIINKSCDGILAVSFCHLHTDYEFVYITCYLPPENSVWGRDSERFFAVLLHIIYSSETENIIIAGDFNSRVGNLSDIIEDVDSIPLRNSIDSHINQHGKNMIEFLEESKFVIINGRGDIGSNDFTCKTWFFCC